MNVESIITRLEKVKRSGKGYVARCPAHGDNRASLSVSEGSTGNVLLNCHAGCNTEDIISALGLSWEDLFSIPTSGKGTGGTPETIYSYFDETGVLLFQVVRMPGKQFRQRQPDSTGGWIWNLEGVRRTLYKLEELGEPGDGAPVVFIAEGEKDVDNLFDHGLIATCSPGGAGKWREEYCALLAHRDVVVLPDNDKTGREHAQTVADSLVGKARSVRVLQLPGLEEKGDVSDWLKAGGDREKLERMVQSLDIWTKGKALKSDGKGFTSSSERLRGEREKRLKLASKLAPVGITFIDDICRGILPHDIFILGAKTGRGKCLSPSTPVLKFDGSTVRAEDVKRGDRLMGPDSEPRVVRGVGRGMDLMYRIIPKNGGDPFECNSVHVLTLRKTGTSEVIDVPLNEYLRWNKTKKHHWKLFRVPVQFPDHPTSAPIDPWLLGFWFADGRKDLHGIRISKPECEAVIHLRAVAKRYGCRVTTSTSNGRCPDHSLVTDRGQPNNLLTAFRELLMPSLAIPDRYRTGSVAERRAFLAGWIDGDGYTSPQSGNTEIITKRDDWADDLAFIARSLGLRVNRSIKKVRLPGWEEPRSYHRLRLTGDTSSWPIKNSHKRCHRVGNRDPLVTGFDVELIGPGPYAGFELDRDGRFLLGDFTVTHNTAMATIIAQRGCAHGLRVYFFALEAEDCEIERRAKYRHLAALLYQAQKSGQLDPKLVARVNYLDWFLGRCDDITRRFEEQAGAEAEAAYKNLFTFYRESRLFDADMLNEKLDEIKNDADLIILDHLHHVDHDESDENKALKQTTKIIRDASISSGIPTIVVAHLRKFGIGGYRSLVPEIDDFHGASQITKDSTRVITIAPARDQVATKPWLAPTYVGMLKDRRCGIQDWVALMEFDIRTFSYEAGYRLGRLNLAGDEWKEVEPQHVPHWAEHAFGHDYDGDAWV